MKALHFIFTRLFFVTTNAVCPSFNINYPPTRTSLCPGDVITYTCVLSSNQAIINILWTGSGFQCSNPGAAVNTITLTQSSGASLNTVPVSCGTNTSAVMTNISGTCYTSFLTISTPQSFNGTTVICKDGTFGTTIGNDTLNVQMISTPSSPTITSLTSPSSDQLTVNWTSVSTATSYNVSINGSTPISLPANANTYTFTGLMKSTTYNVTVVAINCGGISATSAVNQAGMGPTAPPTTSSTAPAFTCPAAVPCSAIGTAVGVSVSVTFMISFSMGVLVASVLCYISRSPKQSSHIPSSHVDPATVYDEVGTRKKTKEDHTQMTANAAYGSHI